MRLNSSGRFRPIQLALVGAALAAALACGGDTTTAVPPNQDISLIPSSAVIAVGDSVKITVVLPPTLQAAGATYVSANTAIAITRTNGWVVAVGRGNTNIAVTSIADPKLSTPFGLSVTP